MDLRSLTPWRRPSASLTRGESSPLASLQREMNRLFEEMSPSGPLSFWRGTALGAFDPSMDVRDTNGEIEVTVELPGLTEKDVNVTLSPDATALTIRGEKKQVKERREESLYQSERSYGMFQRTIPLPMPVEADKVTASFKNGILEIRLPKNEESQRNARRIDIKAT